MIRAEYVSGNETLEALAKKHGVSKRQIYAHSKEGKWPAARERHRRKVAGKAIARAGARARKAIEKEIMEPVLVSARRYAKMLEEDLRDPRLLHRHLGIVSDGNGGAQTEEFDFEAINSATMINVARTFDKLADALYKAAGLTAAREDRKLDLQERTVALAESQAQREQDKDREEVVFRMEGVPEEYTP